MCSCALLKAGVKVLGEPGGQLSLSHPRVFIRASFTGAKQLDRSLLTVLAASLLSFLEICFVERTLT